MNPRRAAEHLGRDVAWLVNAGNLNRALGNLDAQLDDGYPPGQGTDRQPAGTYNSTDHVAARILAAQHSANLRATLNHIDALADLAQRVVAALCDQVRGVRDPGISTETEARYDRCEGDPLCDRLAVRRVWDSGTQRQLCWTCIKRLQRTR